MLRGLYTSASGLLAGQAHLDVVANNLANADTAGYKRDQIVFESFPAMFLSRVRDPDAVPGTITGTLPGAAPGVEAVGPLGTGTLAAGVYADHAAGPILTTGNPLDLALVGTGLFTVRTDRGDRYTRQGNFVLDAQGRLATPEGHLVLGERGPITVGSKEVTVDAGGRVFLDGAYADRLAIVEVNDPGALKKEGASLYADPGGAARPATATGVEQGALEKSNVNPVLEMVNMIAVMRAYEANQKVVQAQDQTLARANEIASI